VNIERETFPAMVEDRTLYALADDSFWIDVGTPARYIDANVAFQGNGSVTDGALVDPTATVESSVVLPGAVVEGGASIRRSIVGRGARIGAGACLDEFTVVGDEAVVPAGTVLVGVRFPEGDE
jgi:mannose-1-phosphate guanylyltransferase